MSNPISTHIAIPQITVYQLRDNDSSKKQILQFVLYNNIKCDNNDK
jgi:hypothetical protein